MRMRSVLIGLAAAAFVASTAEAGTIYDAAKDFSSSNNPNGVWSYGWTQTLGSAFVQDAQNGSEQGLDFWHGTTIGAFSSLYPYVAHNGTDSTILYYGGVNYAPGQMTLHPGPDGQYADVRFTSPNAGAYSLAAAFTGVDTLGTSTDVHIFLNGVSIFDGAVNGNGASQDYTGSLTLSVGDVVDFVVGYGSNRSYNSDSTALSATLTYTPAAAVPEPSGVVLAGIGIAALSAWRMRGR